MFTMNNMPIHYDDPQQIFEKNEINENNLLMEHEYIIKTQRQYQMFAM